MRRKPNVAHRCFIPSNRFILVATEVQESRRIQLQGPPLDGQIMNCTSYIFLLNQMSKIFPVVVRSLAPPFPDPPYLIPPALRLFDTPNTQGFPLRRPSPPHRPAAFPDSPCSRPPLRKQFATSTVTPPPQPASSHSPHPPPNYPLFLFQFSTNKYIVISA